MDYGFILFILIGLAIILTPTSILVQIDSRTGHWIYKKRLESTGEEELALRAASFFYKIFGSIFLFVGLLVGFISIW